jgi:hypothetical protein
MHRKVRIVLPCVLAALLAGHTAAWLAGTHYLRTAFDAWTAQRRAAGWEVESAPPRRGGWPLAAALTVPDLMLAAGPANAPGRIAWHAERAVLSLSLQRPTVLDIDIAGAQTLRLAPGPALRFDAERTHIEAPVMGRTSGPVASLEVRTLRGEGLTIGLLTAQASAGASPAVSTSAEAIDLPASMTWPLGPHISSLAIDATLHGGLPPPGSLPASAAAWRDAGGALEISHFALGWGPLGLAATARLELDGQLQPEGTADLRLIGYAKALDALAAQHWITRNAALAATAVLTLLARVPQDGGAPEVEVPLGLREGKLSMGHTPLLKLPELRWAGE